MFGSIAAQWSIRLWLLIVSLFVSGLWMFAGRPTAATTDTDAKKPDALVQLNAAFRDAYRSNRADHLKQLEPIVISEGDTLVLFHRGQRHERTYMPAIYDQLKAFCHVPLALYVMLRNATDGPLSEERIDGLIRYRKLIVAAQPQLAELRLDAETQKEITAICASSVKFMDSVVERRRVKRDELLLFTREMGTSTDRIGAKAAQAQIDALNAQMKSWRRDFSADEWQRLRIIVMGTQMTRKGNVALQYFARLLGVPGECQRLVFSEAIFDESKALALLGTRVVDQDIGAAFFNDDQRMMHDLLEPAAQEYLKKLPIE